MRLYFAGAEIGSHRKLLHENGVRDMSLSYIGLGRRVKFARPWLLETHFEDDTKILLDSGCYTLNKESSDITAEKATELAAGYMAFVTANAERAELISEFDAEILGKAWIENMREEFYGQLPGDKLMVIWHGSDGLDALDSLCSAYRHVGVAQGDLNADLTSHLNSLVQRYGVQLHGVAMTQLDAMQEVKWDSVGSTSWLSPSQWGDTHFWTGRELKRYPKDQKDRARAKHRLAISDLGFDADKVIADDPTEVSRLGIWSWLQFTDHINTRQRKRGRPRTGGSREVDSASVGDHEGEVVNSRPGAALVKPREKVLIPLLNVGLRTITGKEGEEETEETFIDASGSSLMACDNCYVRDKCPKFEAEAECAYELPVEVTTPAQLHQLINVLIKIQTQRCLRMVMIEQLEGGFVQGDTGPEFDRLARLIKLRTDAQQEGFDIHVRAKGPGTGGYLTGMMGPEKAALAAAYRDGPVDTDAAMETLTAEVISEVAG